MAVEVAMRGKVCGGSGGEFGGGSGGIGIGSGSGDGDDGGSGEVRVRVRARAVALAMKVAVVAVGRERQRRQFVGAHEKPLVGRKNTIDCGRQCREIKVVGEPIHRF